MYLFVCLFIYLMHLWSYCQSRNPDQTQKTQRNNMICSKNIFIVFRLIWKRRLSQQQLSDHPGLIIRLVRLIWANVSFYWSINAEPSTTSSWFQCLLFINVMFSLTQLKYLSLPPRRNLARIQVVYSDTMWPDGDSFCVNPGAKRDRTYCARLKKASMTAANTKMRTWWFLSLLLLSRTSSTC